MNQYIKKVLSNAFADATTSTPIKYFIDKYTVDATEIRRTARENEELWYYDSDKIIEFELPDCSTETPKVIKKKVGKHEIERPFVAEFRRCEVVGPSGLSITEDGRFLLEQALRSENLLLRDILATLRAGIVPVRSQPNSSRYDAETAVSMVGPWCKGYFHWFSEWLPRLEGVEHYVDRTKRRPTLILPPDPPPWMVSSIELLGYDDYTEWDSSREVIERLVVPSVRRAKPVEGSGGYTNSHRGYEWVREKVLDGLETEPPRGGSRRIYISRQNAEERKVTNEDEVLDLLETRGFESYQLENMSFRDQASLFSEADVVVAPHGAGLVNTIFGEDITILEMFGKYENACYFTLAEGMGFEYSCLKCKPEGPHVRVELPRLATQIDKLL